MNKILLASHGYLAQGMKSSLEILMGTNDRIECLCAYIDDDSRDVAALDRCMDGDEGPCRLLVCRD